MVVATSAIKLKIILKTKNQKTQKTPQQPKNKQANKQLKQQQQFDDYSWK